MGLTDGLGFEEVNQSGLSTNLSQAVSGVYTRSIGTNVIGTTDISGLDVFATGSVIGGRINDGNGALFSASAHNSGTTVTAYGAKIYVGSCSTTSAGFGSAIFPAQFSDTQYFFTAQAGSTSVIDTDESVSGLIAISGANGRNVSGVTFWGAASTPYTWVAIGL